jgi:23S rRNA (pseudouridine1915-N3)-methyltransferase
MRIDILAVGTRMPTWVTAGVDEYLGRLPAPVRPAVIEIPPGRRSASAPAAAAVATEAQRLLRRAERAERVIALDQRGRQWSSAELATELKRWQDRAGDVALLIGGPDGLGAACHDRADATWALSSLTLPHGLVRIVLVEQLYRAWTILQGHPYHRE